jgi:hypothetical protein
VKDYFEEENSNYLKKIQTEARFADDKLYVPLFNLGKFEAI